MAQFNYYVALMDNLSLFGKFLLVLLDATEIQTAEDAEKSGAAAAAAEFSLLRR